MNYNIGDYFSWRNNSLKKTFFYKLIEIENNKDEPYILKILNPINTNKLTNTFSDDLMQKHFKKITIDQYIAGRMLE